MKKLRLLITDKCNRSCPGCCNKEWDLNKLPVCTSFKGYDEIMLTGGEPGIKVKLLLDTIKLVRKENNKAKIYLYTAFHKVLLHFDIISRLDGITFTLHEKKDADLFEVIELSQKRLNRSAYETKIVEHQGITGVITMYSTSKKSLRLNIFKGVRVPKLYNNWEVKKGIEWIKNCPLPKDEIFMRL